MELTRKQEQLLEDIADSLRTIAKASQEQTTAIMTVGHDVSRFQASLNSGIRGAHERLDTMNNELTEIRKAIQRT